MAVHGTTAMPPLAEDLGAAGPIIIDHTCTDLSQVPDYWIDQAKAVLRVSYGHTSHGSQPITGMSVLEDNTPSGLYDFNTNGAIAAGVLSIADRVPDGDLGNLLLQPAGGTRQTTTQETFDQKKHLLTMKGNEVFKHAVKRMGEAATRVVKKAGLTKDDIDYLIPHQANIRIIQATARKLRMPMERVVVTVGEQGNTSAASVPLALDTAVRDGRVKRGEILLLEAFGGGFTWGSALVRF